MVEIKNAGWDHAEARAFVEDLENALPLKNPYAMKTITGQLGTSDLSELKQALVHFLVETEGRAIEWNPSARDMQVLASARDICDHMGELVGKKIKWSRELESQPTRPRRTLLSRLCHKSVDLSTPVIVVSFDRSAAGPDARLIQFELAAKLCEPVHMGEEAGQTVDLSLLERPGSALVLLLTKGVLADNAAMAEAYQAIKHGCVVVPICVAGRGYDYSTASGALASLDALWAPEEEAPRVPGALLSVIPNTISVDWRPEGGQNQTAAAVAEVAERIGAHRVQTRLHAAHSHRLSSTRRRSFSKRAAVDKDIDDDEADPSRLAKQSEVGLG